METMWCSKYALSSGVVAHKGVRKGDSFTPDGWMCTYWRVGKDVHETREAACAVAEKIRQRKIISLEKQIKNLRETSFVD